jgi:murein DD-endopeptidase MepM/ murein hydrolase activator NlpD
MQVSVLKRNGLKLSQGAAVLVLAGMAAGCSSQVARFGGVDDFMTASTPNQREIIRPSGDTSSAPLADTQSYPGATAANSSGSVTRGELAPVAAAPATAQPTQTASIPLAPGVDSTPKAVAPAAPKPKDRSASATIASGTYKVQEGDTLSRISRNTGVSVTAIKEANGLSDGAIRIGQTLKIPGAGTVKVAAAAPATGKVASPAPATDKVVTSTTKPAETAAAKPATKSEQVAAYTPPKKTEKVIEQAEEDGAAAPDATGIGRMRWPVRGRVISQYGKGTGKSNDGIDISVPEGTPVKAAENGVVIYAGDGLKEFGNTVLVRHEDGLVTVYGHASTLKVTRGEKVKRGQEIAVSGMSGQTDAPKLHFEVRKNSSPVDPSAYLE